MKLPNRISQELLIRIGLLKRPTETINVKQVADAFIIAGYNLGIEESLKVVMGMTAKITNTKERKRCSSSK